MSWHCSQALVAGYWAGTSLGGARSAPSNTTPMPEAYYWPDKTTEHSRLSRFGMTSEPLMADRGAELLTWFLEVSLARTSAQPGGVQVSTESEADSGRIWLASFAKENSPILTSRGLGRVLGDLAAMGFDAEWGVVSAADAGAFHLRERIWVVADAVRSGLQGNRAISHGEDWERGRREPTSCRRWPSEPLVGRVAHGVAHRVDRIKALGNGQVPRVAAAAFQILSGDN
jgi:hypothetical protein